MDVFSAATNRFVGRLSGTGLVFVGQAANIDTSGPNGVAVLTSGRAATVYAGDGDSTVKAFNTGGPTETPTATISTGSASADRRADSVIAVPEDNRLVVNGAAEVPFVSLIDTATNRVVRKIPFDSTNGTPNAGDGIESVAYDPNNDRVYAAVPKIGASGPGSLAEIDPAVLWSKRHQLQNVAALMANTRTLRKVARTYVSSVGHAS